jgi:DNA polymerase-3 subunit epsilon
MSADPRLDGIEQEGLDVRTYVRYREVMQRSFDDLGQPLVEVTFVVIDLETTGGAPDNDAITEVGAVKLRGGVCLGTLQSLVDPGVAIPPFITYLTGITEAMVAPAPRIDAILPLVVDFIGDAVVVGHNVGFDLRFLNANLRRHGHAPLANRMVDTCSLARRLVREEVRDCKLSTLADRFGLPHRPRHRALDDALATGDLLHALLERAGSLGVLAIDDLIALPTIKGHPQVAKLKLAAGLPRAPGVYLFRDGTGRVIYVGKAVDLRRRVRSYFSGSGDDRRKIGAMMRTLARIDHVVCGGELEAGVLEIRMIQHHVPQYNRQAKNWPRYAYVKFTAAERWPRLAVVRTTPPDGSIYLGPVASTRTGHLIAEAIETVVGLRRCRRRVPAAPGRDGPCTPAQLGVALCPCTGAVDPERYAGLVAVVRAGLTRSPDVLLAPLDDRIKALAAARRFEEAASVRDRAGALARALTRQRRLDALRAAGRLVLDGTDGGPVVLEAGRLAHTTGALEGWDRPPPGDPTVPLARDEVDELNLVLHWMDRHADRLRVEEASAGLAWPARRLHDFLPTSRQAA